ncbi:hypothetical protein MNBD_UNCLBAC01-1956 [hydrothermal vent metagenome]|uniref:Uncharacterized protein n=1 Tax=hydrothermal vent metagenome TaxID=652676 RepID=A0A3B1DHD0_9ZZZZ
MIKIDISLAIAIFLCIFCFLVFIVWIFYNYHGKATIGKIECLKQCTYCSYVFFNYSEEHEYVCPQCKSYLQKGKG